MTRHDEEYWRRRASTMLDAQVKLSFILRELVELMPETRSLHGIEFDQLTSAIDTIVERHARGELDRKQAVDEFFELVFDSVDYVAAA